MKKTRKAKSKRGRGPHSEMRGEYRFDYGRAKTSRFAKQLPEGSVAVVLEPDVAAEFGSSQAVNSLLRSLITSGRQKKRRAN